MRRPYHVRSRVEVERGEGGGDRGGEGKEEGDREGEEGIRLPIYYQHASLP